MTTTGTRPGTTPASSRRPAPPRGGPTPWTVWLATVALGGAMTYEELAATLAGTRAGSPAEHYLIAQAQNP